MSDYMSLLNPDQKSAVTQVDGPVLILAGAGTGKTRTITARVAHIINDGHAQTDEILAVTFTNKAANEMASRVFQLTNKKLPWLGTFHSIAAKILRRHAKAVGLNNNFVILDMEDQLQIVRNIAKTLNLSKSDKPNAIINVIQKWKEKSLLPSEVEGVSRFTPLYTTSLKVYHLYQERLKQLNCVDFGDLLLFNVRLFKHNSEILAFYQTKFKYIMVDEFQDTNALQYQWLKYLAQKHSNLCCVGDDDQSIYSWRGAEVDNILKFSKDFNNTKTVKLECNYRSTSHILEAASKLISNNKARLGKTLWTKNGQGQKLNVVKCSDGNAEAKFISDEILKLNDTYKFSDFAVLVRAAYQTRILEEHFVRNSIPYRITCGVKFYERQEIRDVVAYLRLIINNNDDLAFERIVNRPKRSVGAATLKKLYASAQASKSCYFEAAQAMVGGKEGAKKLKNALNDFTNKIITWGEVMKEKPLHEFVENVMAESGYINMLQQEGPTGETRIENVKELIGSLKHFDNVGDFLEHIGLVSEVDNLNNGNTVNVMTLHAAKGLEFPCVFLPGWEEGIFPHQRSLSDVSGKALEEERRLAYVGITRAKERIFISHAEERETFNQVVSNPKSRFAKELPKVNTTVVKNELV